MKGLIIFLGGVVTGALGVILFAAAPAWLPPLPGESNPFAEPWGDC